MNGSERLPTKTHKSFIGYLWGAPTALTRPCHLSILTVVLAGTTTDTFIGEYWDTAVPMLTGSFVLSMTRLLRAFRDGS